VKNLLKFQRFFLGDHFFGAPSRPITRKRDCYVKLYLAGDDLPRSSTAGSTDDVYSGDSADEGDNDYYGDDDDDDDATAEGNSTPGK